MKHFISLAFLAGVLVGMPLPAQQSEKNPVVVMDTSHGKISIELFAEKAPITVKNFLQYTDDKFYDGTIFHRVIADFMIQGGGFEAGQLDREKKKTRDPIKNEAGNGVANERGTIAMARTDDPDSATAQFFINVKDNDFLNRAGNKAGYAVFGKVVSGMDIVDKIRQVETGRRAGQKDVPTQDVVIRSVRRK